jgi:hypothetical protein
MALLRKPQENRRFGRRNTTYSGWIRVPGRPPQTCMVLNISLGGALLECHQPQALPYNFELIIDAMNARYACEARHCTSTTIGVEFSHVAHEAAQSALQRETSRGWGEISDRTVRHLDEAVGRISGRHVIANRR